MKKLIIVALIIGAFLSGSVFGRGNSADVLDLNTVQTFEVEENSVNLITFDGNVYRIDK